MSLSEIKQKLYQKKTEETLPEFVPKRLSESPKINETSGPEEELADEWEVPEKGLTAADRNWIKIGLISLGSVVLLVGIFFGVFKFLFSSFSDTNVSVSLSGPTQVRSGKLVSYEIVYKNDNRVDLRDAVLKISYPENFKPSDSSGLESENETNGIVRVGTLAKHSSGKFVLSGRAYSPKGALIYIKASLDYEPSNFSSRFLAENQFSFNVESSPITLDITYPQSVNSGDEINYVINYTNSGEEEFPNIKIKADYPESFTFISSDPGSMEGNNIWYVGNLAAGGGGKLSIKGKLSGERNEVKPLKISIGAFENGTFITYNEEDANVKIAASPLFISQKLTGKDNLTVNAGETLLFEVFFRNDGNVSLRDAIVTETLSSPALDFSTLKIEGGAYDSNKDTVTWKAVDYPILKNMDPGQSGTIRFSIKVKDSFPVKTINDKNFVIESVSKIDSPDIPTPIAMNKVISSNTMDLKVNSKIGLETLGYFKDAVISNSGTLPPVVGQETTYALHWKLTNVNNDLEEAKVEASLPTGVSFTGKISPENENFSFNERTNLLTWNVGKLSSAVGITSPSREVAFQIKIKPSIDQVGKTPDILGKSVFSAKDSFTGEVLTTESKGKTTNLFEDSEVNTKGSKVVAN